MNKRPYSSTLLKQPNIKTGSPKYYFENGFRKVEPYYFEYQTFAKERWCGRPIVQVFKKEFRDRSPAYYEQAIESELIRVNGKPCKGDYILRPSDAICHLIHRHEPPVTAQRIEIVYRSEVFLVANKPASIPTHPSGRYRYNSLTEILRNSHSFSHLSVINRLDRLTSGLVLLALSPKHAETLHQQMERREFQKEYVCRVKGVFPQEQVTCRMPLRMVEHKLGLVAVAEKNGSNNVKDAETIFERVSTDGLESVVIAKPVTGRTHQIRVHLQYLGYPISNDQLYNTGHLTGYNGNRVLTPNELETIADKLHYQILLSENDGQILQPNAPCPDCKVLKTDPEVDKLYIHLHAYKYSCSEWSFQIDWPSWTRQ